MARAMRALLVMPRLPQVIAIFMPGLIFPPRSSRSSSFWTVEAISSTGMHVRSKFCRMRTILGMGWFLMRSVMVSMERLLSEVL
jgi:hypothetical protein